MISVEFKYYAKLNRNKRSIREVFLLVGILCFIVAIFIGIILKIYYYLYMLVPMFYLILLFVKIRSRKNMLVDAIVYLKFEDVNVFISEMTLDEKPIKEERASYKDIKEFNVYENGYIVIETTKNSFNFWINKEDKNQLNEILYAIAEKIKV